MTDAEREIRERCLETAVRADPVNALELARQFLAFVTGESDLTPRRRVEALLDEAGVS
ncbi:MAG: hypothetical protein QOG84_2291 [Sphingomonadales bacterium]|jgi:hypothetical protein|nr:hypothetical protein [Sphingomonadales bacterium]